MVLSVTMAVFQFGVPLRGSLWVLAVCSVLFLLTALGMGLLISIVTKNQFVAGMVAILATFLPAFLLSGFLFDLGSMPAVVRFITHAVAARYFVAIVQTPVPGRGRLDGDPAQCRRPGPDGGLLPGAQPPPAAASASSKPMFDHLLALTIKEFLALFKDKRSRMVVIVPPLIQLLVFGYAASFDLNAVPYAVYDRDQGYAARDLLARFQGSPTFALAGQITHQGEIAELIDDRAVLLVVQVGPDFTADLAAGRTAQLQVLIDGRNSNSAQIALNDVNQIVNQFNADWIAAHGLAGAPVSLVTRAWYNPNLESRWFFVTGLVGLLTMVVTMMVTVAVGGAGARTGDLRSTPGDAAAPGGDPDRQGHAGGGDRGLRGEPGGAAGGLLVRGALPGRAVGAVSGHPALRAGGGRGGADDLVAGPDPAAGTAGGLSVPGPGGGAVRLRHPHRQHDPGRSRP